MTPDLAEYLQARILSDLSTLKVAMATHAPGERPDSEESGTVEVLQARVAALQDALAKAEAMAEQRREEAEAATERADRLVADLVEITGELLEVSKRDDRPSGNEQAPAA